MFIYAEVNADSRVTGVVKSPSPLVSESLVEIAEHVDLLNSKGVIYTYNSETGAIEESVDLHLLKESAWILIKQLRDQLEFGGFEYEGNIYDSDQVSQGRIMGAAIAGVDQVWTLADNTTVSLSGTKIKELYQALQAHIAEVHERGRIARQAIESAVTKEEVEVIQL